MEEKKRKPGFYWVKQKNTEGTSIPHDGWTIAEYVDSTQGGGWLWIDFITDDSEWVEIHEERIERPVKVDVVIIGK